MSLRVQLYELTHRGNPGDLAFYQRLCRGLPSVLELGCGYGRVLAALDGTVLELVGLDSDAELLDRARQLAPGAQLVEGDLRDFDLERRFECVLVPFNTLYCLRHGERLPFFARIAKHLSPGGHLALDVWNADALCENAMGDEEEYPSGEAERLFNVCVNGSDWEVYEWGYWNREEAHYGAEYQHLCRASGKELSYAIDHFYTSRSQLEAELEQSGFGIERVEGGFAGQAWNRDSEVSCVLAKKLLTPIPPASEPKRGAARVAQAPPGSR